MFDVGKVKLDLCHNFKMALGIPVLTRYCLFIIKSISCQHVYKHNHYYLFNVVYLPMSDSGR